MVAKETSRDPFTWPELKEVMKNFNVFFKIQSAGEFFRIREDSVVVGRSLLPLIEQHWSKAHSQILAGHLIHFVVRSHQLQVI